jgi:hypothetical protein
MWTTNKDPFAATHQHSKVSCSPPSTSHMSSFLLMHHDHTSKQTSHIKPVRTSIRTLCRHHLCSFSIRHHFQHFPTQHHQQTFSQTHQIISLCLTGTDPACTASRPAASEAAVCLWPVETKPTERRFSAGQQPKRPTLEQQADSGFAGSTM